MNTSDYLGAALFGAFGLWWVLLPASVSRFYSSFHRGRVRLPSPAGIRLAGVLWLVVVVVVSFAARK